MTREKKIYVFPIGNVEVNLLSREEFDEIVKKGKAKGHTHIKFMCVGYCDRVESFDSTAFKNISENLEGHNVYFVRTGFPVYANYNRYCYKPEVVGVSEEENNSLGNGLASFIRN